MVILSMDTGGIYGIILDWVGAKVKNINKSPTRKNFKDKHQELWKENNE